MGIVASKVPSEITRRQPFVGLSSVFNAAKWSVRMYELRRLAGNNSRIWFYIYPWICMNMGRKFNHEAATKFMSSRPGNGTAKVGINEWISPFEGSRHSENTKFPFLRYVRRVADSKIQCIDPRPTTDWNDWPQHAARLRLVSFDCPRSFGHDKCET